jgi:hypothetical protein
MVKPLSIVALLCALTGGIAARQADSQAQAADPQLEKARNEVRTYEIVLFQSIESAGQKLAAWAQQVVPQTVLSPAADPVVNGIMLPDSSVIFMVRIPELNGVTVFNNYPRFLQSPGIVTPETGPARPVSTPGTQTGDPKPGEAKVNSTTVVTDDPMKNTPAGPPNPNTMYSDFIRLGLMDAMLDSSAVLSLKDGQWLTVAVVPVDVLVTNALYRNTSRKLILSIKAEDLLAFRAGKITRDEAKLKIVDKRF